MEKISAVIIALNEEKRIADAIRSLEGLADEIIVVDSFSTDRTAEIAREAGCRVEQRRFAGFGTQRQYATSLTSYRYVLFLDADEVLSPALRESLAALKAEGLGHRVYIFDRLNFFCNNPVRHCGWYPDRHVRLFDKRYATWNFNDINEQVIFPEALQPQPVDGEILHYRCSTIDEYRNKMTSQARISGRVLAVKGKMINPIVAFWNSMKAFLGCYIGKGGIMDGPSGREISRECYRKTSQAYKFAREFRKEAAR